MKYVAIRKEKNDLLYMDKNFFDRFAEEDLETYGYTKVEAPEDCEVSDFNDDLTFSEEKYNQRKEQKAKAERLIQIKKRLSELSENIIQVQAGAVIENSEEMFEEFRTLHNEARELEGKQPRKYLGVEEDADTI